mgnify:FL=1
MRKISIVTGTLNRKPYLSSLLNNTVWADHRIEIVLVDGGSTDGTVELLEHLSNTEPRIKFIQVGERSPYPHYMNLGIQNASHELVCQWNDDILLVNNWEDVFSQIDEDHDAYLFNWKEGSPYDTEDESWLKCNHIRDNGWNLHNCADYSYANPVQGEIVMNYGMYKKDVFRKHGLYNDEYNYYCADGEMSMRAYYGGAKFKTCTDIKVCVLPAEKRAIMDNTDISRYHSACTRILRNSYQFLGEFLT